MSADERVTLWPEAGANARFAFTWEPCPHAPEHVIDWKAYEVTAWDPKTGEELFGEISDLRTTYEGTEVYASGGLKWDGCVNMEFDAQKDGMLHFCGPEKDPKLAVLMRGVYALGPNIPAWMHR